ncbi:hypothetical protein KKA00_04025 [bacterium]|nr:hypothetical protein [bacterium]MBU1651362.1 hypothetical protein [bacterium]
MHRVTKATAILIGFVLIVYLLSGCGFKAVYMLDQPVSDPLMYADDAQDSDICRVEDGGISGASGSCPT